MELESTESFETAAARAHLGHPQWVEVVYSGRANSPVQRIKQWKALKDALWIADMLQVDAHISGDPHRPFSKGAVLKVAGPTVRVQTVIDTLIATDSSRFTIVADPHHLEKGFTPHIHPLVTTHLLPDATFNQLHAAAQAGSPVSIHFTYRYNGGHADSGPLASPRQARDLLLAQAKQRGIIADVSLLPEGKKTIYVATLDITLSGDPIGITKLLMGHVIPLFDLYVPKQR